MHSSLIDISVDAVISGVLIPVFLVICLLISIIFIAKLLHRRHVKARRTASAANILLRCSTPLYHSLLPTYSFLQNVAARQK